MLTPFVHVGTSRGKRKAVQHVRRSRSEGTVPDPFRADQIRAWSEAIPRYAFAVAVIGAVYHLFAHGQVSSGLGMLIVVACRIWPKPK